MAPLTLTLTFTTTTTTTTIMGMTTQGMYRWDALGGP
ncbi:hypothetical protein F0726_00060 [Acidithiobacillus caldus]|nr:hypothetical protein F0726_00060 [Acidithiobacillus caldus]